MLRRLRLPGKLVVAALPLVLILLVTAGFLVAATLQEAAEAQETAALAATWEPLTSALEAVDAEESATIAAARGEAVDLAAARAAADAAIGDVEAALRGAGSPPALLRQLGLARQALVEVRALFDDTPESDALHREKLAEGFQQVEERVLQVGDLIPAEVTDRSLARDLAAVAALGHARDAALSQEQAVLSRLNDERAFGATVEIVRAARADLAQALAAFQGAASQEWVDRYLGAEEAFAGAGEMIDKLIESPIDVLTTPNEEWQARFDARSAVLVDLQTSLTADVISQATASAGRARTEAFAIAGAVVLGVVIAGLVTLFISRSIVLRVRNLTDRARHVAQEQLPALVEALRAPSEDVELPSIPPLRDKGADEVADLSRSFAAMQFTLQHVAEQQIEVLRKGVADIFVTLARRNRSLIDRQLALIDQLEADEEDPELLADFYRLDHLATRMRRNAESLLVLAGTDTPRTYWQSLEIDDVVRAALGEVEDYRRIDVLTLEPLELHGSAVADISHLLSELLENATSFSPPDSRVRVAGHFHEKGYLITITDRGVGVPEERLAELNRLLESPPVVGLALEPTLGLYVVAMLAKRHGVKVRLAPGAPGITANVMIPPTLFEVRQRPALSDLGGADGPLREVRIGVSGNGQAPSPNGDLQPRPLRPRPIPEERPAPPAPAPSPAASPASSPPSPPVAAPSNGDAGRHTPAPLSRPVTPPPPPAPAPPPPPAPAPPPPVPPAPPPPPAPAPPPPVPPAPGPSNLPTRVPGAHYRDDEVAAPMGEGLAPEELRQRLGAFEEGRRRAVDGTDDLPTRRPGENLAEDLDEEQAAVAAPDPDRVRSALSSYQIGMQAGRRLSGPAEREGGEEHE